GQFVGTLAGSNAGTIDNVTASGTVNGKPNNVSLHGLLVGGLVGQNGILGPATAGSITHAHANVTVTVGDGATGPNGGFNSAGGLVGSNVAGSTIAQSDAAGAVTGGANASVGGLVGQNGFGGSGNIAGTTGIIQNSFATGAVTVTGAGGSAGGLAGAQGPGSTITDSQAFGAVASTASGPGNNGEFAPVGGLVGANQGTITSSSA